jgi:DNA-binding XRE family transcriptional regulator
MNWQHNLDGDVLKEIGLAIKQLRLNSKLSQQDLAERIGVNRKKIWSIEKGQNTSILTFIKLLKVFNRLDQLQDLLHSNPISPKDLFEKNNS